MARRFAKVSEEEIEEAFCYPSDLVKLILKQLSPSGSVKSGGYICCSTIFSFSTIFSELVQNTLNWYNCNCTGLFLSTV